MPDEAGQGSRGVPPLETLADKISWLMERANPGGQGPLSAQDVSYLMLEVAGEKYSPNAVWRLATGDQANPGYRVIRALAKVFGVEPGFFFDDYDEQKLGLVKEQVELLALVRDAKITSVQFRALMGMDAEGREMFADMIRRVAIAEARVQGASAGQGENSGSS
jgi:transcriptional regulator with XRE-family HTH domain